ncbi:thioesterase family protein [uncultured Microscilla sp.]|uniref:acyl-CoA thioesterase n=1 Tax=uncultured Microscilla sp. TaxID=432653 RepID=UPI00260853E8|nr:thioesterase family protein [uncultured Microscilla sp.]
MTNQPNLSLFKFKHSLRVRWAEVDPQQVVFNGHYLTYFDVAFTEYFRVLGLTYPDGLKQYNCDMYVRKTTIEYHAPARFDDELTIYVRTSDLGNTSITIQMEITCQQQHLVSGTLIYVNVDVQTQRPMTLPQGVREVFEHYENLTT